MDFVGAGLPGMGESAGRRTPDRENQEPARSEEQGNEDDSPRLSTATGPGASSSNAEPPGLEPRGRRADDEFSEDEGDGPKPSSPGDALTKSKTQDGPSQQLSEDGTQTGESASPPSSTTTSAQTQRFPVVTRPAAAQTQERETRRHVRRSRFNGENLAELYLADRVESGNLQQQQPQQQQNPAQQGQGGSDRSRSRRRREPPKKYLCCLPWVRSRRARSLMLRCVVSGISVLVTLTIYLSLSLTRNINTSEFNVLLILLVLLTTVFFIHAVIRLCIILVRLRNRWGSSTHAIVFHKSSRSEYAIPRHPIRVILSRDEEAVGIESEAVKMGPPAYGRWRESVRIDPNAFYWQRADPETNAWRNSGTILHRPPSYVSDDGVDYVLSAHPRSVGPPSFFNTSQPTTVRIPTTASNVPNEPGQVRPVERDSTQQETCTTV